MKTFGTVHAVFAMVSVNEGCLCNG